MSKQVSEDLMDLANHLDREGRPEAARICLMGVLLIDSWTPKPKD